MGETTMADAGLAAALKQAKGKKMFFAFILKGSEGKLIVSKVKFNTKQIADAKKESGGGVAVTGKCFGGEGGTMVFEVVKAPPATLGAALKKVAQREAGVVIKPDVRIAGDADSEEEDAGPAAPRAAGRPEKSAPPVPAEGAGKGPSAPGAGAPDLAPWEKAREHAIKDLKAFARKVVATRHSSAAAVLKELNYIITKLPAKPALQDIAKLETFVRQDDTITAVEDVPADFHKLDIRKPLLQALQVMKK
jgi:hypothetical protein